MCLRNATSTVQRTKGLCLWPHNFTARKNTGSTPKNFDLGMEMAELAVLIRNTLLEFDAGDINTTLLASYHYHPHK